MPLSHSGTAIQWHDKIKQSTSHMLYATHGLDILMDVKNDWSLSSTQFRRQSFYPLRNDSLDLEYKPNSRSVMIMP